MLSVLLFPLAAAGVPTVHATDAPARVVNPRAEGDLSTVHLSTDAEERLGIVVQPVDQQSVRRVRIFGGEVMIPADGGAERSLVLQSPTDRVQAAQALVTADSEVDAARVEVDAAEIELARAEKVLASGAGSARAVQEARTKLRLTQTRRAAAEGRRDVLARASFGGTGKLWLRVPVYAGNTADLDLTVPARVGRLGELEKATSVTPHTATPVRGPLSANPDAATVDLFFEIDNEHGEWRPGERVDVAVTKHSEGVAETVPWSAILHDSHGGEWLYQRIAPRVFARQRVQVRFVSDGRAALTNGLAPGAEVVVEGAAELFGAEFAPAK